MNVFKLLFKKFLYIFKKISISFKVLFDSNKSLDFEDVKIKLESYSKNPKTTSIYDGNIDEEYNDIKFSVIIPAYNVATRIESCIESVLSQNVSYNYEIIIVNDGSTDNTLDVLNKYKNIDNIIVINQENQGCSSARNNGIYVARGEYLIFLDSDDKLLENSLNNLIDTAIKYDADIVEGGFKEFYSNGITIKKPSTSVLIQTKKFNGELAGYPCGKAYKRSLFNNVRFPLNYWYEDSINDHIIYYMAKKCIIIPELVYGYVKSISGISHSSKGNLKSIDSLYITESLLCDHEKLDLPFTQEYYEYFLRMVDLTYKRTKELSYEIKKYIFIYQCYLHQKYFYNFTTNIRKLKRIEKSLKDKNFKKYIIFIEWF